MLYHMKLRDREPRGQLRIGLIKRGKCGHSISKTKNDAERRGFRGFSFLSDESHLRLRAAALCVTLPDHSAALFTGSLTVLPREHDPDPMFPVLLDGGIYTLSTTSRT